MSTDGPKANGTSGPKGRAGRGNPNWLKREKNWLTAERVAFGTNGTKRREPAEPGEMSQ
ncbi:hypothetical protein KI387_015039, partial [Taxus chinensis]